MTFKTRPKVPIPTLDILTYCVEPGRLYARPGPRKSNWHLDQLKAAGIRAVLSLVSLDDPEEVKRAGLFHYCQPIEEHLHKPYVHGNKFWYPIFERFDEIAIFHFARHEPLLVHCNSGKDRTGLLMAYYLATRKEVKPKKALRWIRQLKPDAMSAKGYEQFFLSLDEYLAERSAKLRATSQEL